MLTTTDASGTFFSRPMTSQLSGGPEDPNAVLVRLDVDGAEYWSSPGSRVATVVSLLKAKVTGESADIGNHAVVEDV